MSKSRFLLKQAAVGSTGQSDLTRYIAKNSLKPSREGRSARPLFTDRDDDLTHWEARKYLSITGGALEREDVLHYILSFEQPEDFEWLGDTDDERREQTRAFLRRALTEGAKSLGVSAWRWAAGIHLNRKHPHIHILINKHAISGKTDDLVRVSKLARPLVAHNDKGADGAREFDYGLILNSFARDVDERIREHARGREIGAEKDREKERANERTKETPQPRRDRLTLAEAMVARETVERLEHSILARERYGIGRSEKLESELRAARARHAGLQFRVGKIRERYQSQNAPLPVPQLSSEELSKLQNGATNRRDAARLRTLEKIRLALDQEGGTQPRSEYEKARLQAQLRVTETDLATSEVRSERFDRAGHLIRWDVSGSRWSLAGIDFALERQFIRLSFNRRGVAALFPSTRRAVRAEVAQLSATRRAVVERINERREELAFERTRAAETVTVLREIRDRETARSSVRNHEKSEVSRTPIFTSAELARMEKCAYAMKDAALLREVHAEIRATEECLAPNGKSYIERSAACAFAQSIIAEIDFKEARERQFENSRKGRFAPVAARLAGGEIITGSLRQFEIRSSVEALVRIFDTSPERRERERVLRSAASERDSAIKADAERAAGYLTAAREIADDCRQELVKAGKTSPPPAFTESEIRRIESYSERSKSAEERDFYARLLDAKGHPLPHDEARGRERLPGAGSRFERQTEADSRATQAHIFSR